MKYSLKNEYKNLINEERVSIETSKGFYDYEFDNIENIDFKNLKFKDGDTDISNAEFRKEILKSEEYSTYNDPGMGVGKFGLGSHTTPEISFIMQFVILRAIKNIVLFEKNAYKVACDSYMSVQDPEEATAITLASIIKFLLKQYNNTQSDYYKLLYDIAEKQYEKTNKSVVLDEYINTIITNVIKYFKDIFPNDSFDKNNVFVKNVLSGPRSTVKKAINMYFKRDFSSSERHRTANFQHTIIAYDYMADAPNALSLFYRGFSKLRQNIGTLPLRAGEESPKDDRQISIRSYVTDLNQIRLILDEANKIEEFKQINKMPAKNRKGKGEFLCHMLFNTSNPSLTIEPDVVIDNIGRFSVKSMATASARTGESLEPEVLAKMIKFFSKIGLDVQDKSQISLNDVEYIVNDFLNNNSSLDINFKKKLEKDYEELKLAVITEHDAMGIFLHKADGTIELKMKQSNDAHGKIEMENVYLLDFKNNRWTFTISDKSDKNISYENALRSLFENNNINLKNKVLKEVYSYLFKKKLINEGGLAGHMMHPYEALDMTPRQIIEKIREYGVPQSIIEKVDGQNLFFTINKDGTLMFARNKEDMTHEDLVNKFTGHPAELPFVEGGNAIKRGVDQWLSSAGEAGEMEIQEIFHPDGETRSFVNFEIMHPEKPNQIIYDQKYIVFHSIVDFVNGRDATHSSNNDERLTKLIRFMEGGISASGFVLASNRTVNLNTLTDIQIADYINKIKEISNILEINEEQYLGDGVQNQIKKEIETEGIQISEDAIRVLYDFALYGEDKSGNSLKSKDFTSLMSKEDVAKLRSIGLTNANKASSKVRKILSPFKNIFVDLGIDLLKGVKSSYMSSETNQMNIDILKDKLQTAIDDLIDYMEKTPQNYWEPEVFGLQQHVDKVVDSDIDNIVSTAVEGGVYDYQGDLIKVTGGFAPMNQILGAAYRDKKGIFPTFKEKFMKQESNRRSLKNIYKLLF